MRNFRIGLDVDGVLSNFFTIYENAVRKLTGRDLFPPRAEFESPPVWDWPEHYGYTKAEIDAVWTYIRVYPLQFWSCAEPFPGSAALVEWLYEIGPEYHVYFITDRPGPGAKYATERWLRVTYGLTNPTVLMSVSGKKGLLAEGLGLTHFVEDRLENALAVARAGVRSYLLNRPYNRRPNALYEEPDNLIRIGSHTELFDCLRRKK